ncbi:uncharacterized protein OCT59_016085 [Rhizophagus irregularis]|uniref:Uncharacterized protein n=2 Tax=Rhizophagus irregularis TaxID=588596 RepID=A0A015KJD3_RHIIW|nr:hypothetical protein RirG_185930 [Rhizophagus irregularis DAOM 197198w]UZO23754.1 hypothetical protein OCT59_016085 [Rhizophagus irregularis]GBC30985.1 hypothetical protein GLOIN_2v1843805 [Rhizophagus irregularis DAOM 181602=DAOM 197198]
MSFASQIIEDEIRYYSEPIIANSDSDAENVYCNDVEEDKKINLTTIGEILNNRIDQLSPYMNTISKGRAINYFSSEVFDECVKITKSNSSKFKGFIILVIGFHYFFWRFADIVTADYKYNKV